MPPTTPAETFARKFSSILLVSKTMLLIKKIFQFSDATIM
jgi:hypothetical protein